MLRLRCVWGMWCAQESRSAFLCVLVRSGEPLPEDRHVGRGSSLVQNKLLSVQRPRFGKSSLGLALAADGRRTNKLNIEKPSFLNPISNMKYVFQKLNILLCHHGMPI